MPNPCADCHNHIGSQKDFEPCLDAEFREEFSAYLCDGCFDDRREHESAENPWLDGDFDDPFLF